MTNNPSADLRRCVALVAGLVALATGLFVIIGNGADSGASLSPAVRAAPVAAVYDPPSPASPRPGNTVVPDQRLRDGLQTVIDAPRASRSFSGSGGIDLQQFGAFDFAWAAEEGMPLFAGEPLVGSVDENSATLSIFPTNDDRDMLFFIESPQLTFALLVARDVLRPGTQVPVFNPDIEFAIGTEPRFCEFAPRAALEIHSLQPVGDGSLSIAMDFQLDCDAAYLTGEPTQFLGALRFNNSTPLDAGGDPVSGTAVVESTGAPADDGDICLIDSTYELVDCVSTNADGSWSIDGFEPGWHILTGQGFDYRTECFSGYDGCEFAEWLLLGGPISVNTGIDFTLRPGCFGAEITIEGTAGDDTLTGTSGDDVIAGLGGNDTISGEGGNDRICAGPGDDAVAGGAGNDIVWLDDGVDRAWGQDDDDRLHGGSGNDILRGGDGADLLTGGEGNDNIAGGRDNDAIFGEDGDDTLRGGTGDDVMFGGFGADTMNGNGGSDEVYGEAGDDPSLLGGPRPDLVDGGEGNDLLRGLGGADELNGGPGDDEILGGAQNDMINGGDGADECNGSSGDFDTAAECEITINVLPPGT